MVHRVKCLHTKTRIFIESHSSPKDGEVWFWGWGFEISMFTRADVDRREQSVIYMRTRLRSFVRTVKGMKTRTWSLGDYSHDLNYVEALEQCEHRFSKRVHFPPRVSFFCCPVCHSALPGIVADAVSFMDSLDSADTWVPWSLWTADARFETDMHFLRYSLNNGILSVSQTIKDATFMEEDDIPGIPDDAPKYVEECVCYSFYGKTESVHFDKTAMWMWIMREIVPRMVGTDIATLTLRGDNLLSLICSGIARFAFEHALKDYEETLCPQFIRMTRSMISLGLTAFRHFFRNGLSPKMNDHLRGVLTEAQYIAFNGNPAFFEEKVRSLNPDEALAFIGQELHCELGKHTQLIFSVVDQCSETSVNAWIDMLHATTTEKNVPIKLYTFMFPAFKRIPRLFDCFLDVFFPEVKKRMVRMEQDAPPAGPREDDDPCSICREIVQGDECVRCATCQKIVHVECFAGWTGRNCPMCRGSSIQGMPRRAEPLEGLDDPLLEQRLRRARYCLWTLEYQKHVVEKMATWGKIPEPWLSCMRNFLFDTRYPLDSACVMQLTEVCAL